MLEAHKLSTQILATVNATLKAKGLLFACGAMVNAMLISVPSSIKNSSGERDLVSQGVAKREEAQGIEASWHIATRLGKRWVAGQEPAHGRDYGEAGEAGEDQGCRWRPGEGVDGGDAQRVNQARAGLQAVRPAGAGEGLG